MTEIIPADTALIVVTVSSLSSHDEEWIGEMTSNLRARFGDDAPLLWVKDETTKVETMDYFEVRALLDALNKRFVA